jgi:ankyrin repeat protein
VHNGADINALDSNNDTPLHKACEFTGDSAIIREDNKIECAKFLLQNGANINLKNNDDRTPFELCVSSLLQTELEKFASNLEDTSFEPILKGGSNINYKLKYLKYKSKYFNLKNKF